MASGVEGKYLPTEEQKDQVRGKIRRLKKKIERHKARDAKKDKQKKSKPKKRKRRGKR